MTNTKSIPQSTDLQNLTSDICERIQHDAYYRVLRSSPYHVKKAHDERMTEQEARRPRELRYANTVTIIFQGELVKAKTRRLVSADGQRGDRRRITEFSKRARKNMLETVSRIDWAVGMATFITLTYHENMRDAALAKRHLRAFQKRMYRKFGNKANLWRLEAQKRGAWHFHLIVWNLPDWTEDDVLKTWQAVTGDRTITQVDTQQIRSARKARSYVSKYVAKRPEVNIRSVFLAIMGCHGWIVLYCLDYLTNLAVFNFTGRFWGIECRALVTWAQVLEISIRVSGAYYNFKRLSRRAWAGVNGDKNLGFSIFVRDVRQWYRCLAKTARSDDRAAFVAWDNFMRKELTCTM